ncbi:MULTISPECIES: GNAT family N-acetyltransferase [Trichocoleus]|uniref:GNAT family N-acetyltransferase n=1 Tax=Trichocoleus desertorum GB2-A4 TaxID=2933944 RepID=A0ABV0J3P7_9CYAN|nr:N-acetyltransferase [Trichocoleus sp. FACHB-46]MBD1861620.1 GNAT family N-acetyltransferase [Trichocoleus sp. FACHB-46]
MSLNYLIQPLTIADQPFLWEMLFEAAHLRDEGETSIQAAMHHPLLARYVEGWGREGDLGFVAIASGTNQKVGAVWVRLWPGTEKGFAYVSDDVPELAIAVLPDYCNQGIGTQLIAHLLEAAKPIYPAISLSVRAHNPALRLYERMGFRAIAGSEVRNRAGGISLTMKLAL